MLRSSPLTPFTFAGDILRALPHGPQRVRGELAAWNSTVRVWRDLLIRARAMRSEIQLYWPSWADPFPGARCRMTKQLDHSWVHIQIVVNIGLRLARLLFRRGVVPSVVADYGLREHDAEVVVAAACLMHCVGMSIHREDHERYSLFLTADKIGTLLENVYEEPEPSIIAAETLHAIIGHRRQGAPFTVEAGIVRVADALDMARGRSRVPFEAGHQNIHSLSAYAIEDVKISPGRDRAVRVEIAMSNSAGIFQVDELLAEKLRGSGLEQHIEVIARIEAEHEQRLLPVFRL